MTLGEPLLGSPPPTRGKQGLEPVEKADSRITPAYAGKTEPAVTRPNWTKDHPRLRGENSALLWEPRPYRGSPPPTRGKLVNTQENIQILRITPAYAGKTSHIFPAFSCHEDHPRLRGENCLYLPKAILFTGSPPPTRGKLVDLKDGQYYRRITPAYAGKTA